MPPIEGIVVEVTEKSIVLLCRDGTFKNIPRSSLGPIPLIGQHISYKEPVQHRRVRLRATLTALASVAVFLLAISAAYFLLPFDSPQAAHIVAVDINPSLELETDEEWTVIAIRPLNEEAKGLVKSLDWKNQPLTQVLRQVVEQSVRAGYLRAGEEAWVSVSMIEREKTKLDVQSLPASQLSPSTDPLPAEPESITAEIEKTVQETFNNHAISGTVEVVKEKLSTYKQAKKEDLSVNKYRLYKSLAKNGVVHSPDEVKHKRIAELKQLEKRNQGHKQNVVQNNRDQKQDKEKYPPFERKEELLDLKTQRLKLDKEKKKFDDKHQETSAFKRNVQRLKHQDEQENNENGMRKAQKEKYWDKKVGQKTKQKKLKKRGTYKSKDKMKEKRNKKKFKRTKDNTRQKGDRDP